MSGMRAPVVAGVGGGVGTTTVAVGLRGHDNGRVTGRRPDGSPDILVCRGTLDSVRRAAAVLDEAGPEPPPVLAVTLAGRVPRGPLRARLELLEPDAAALVLLPHVRRWCTLTDPLAEAAQLLVEPVAQLPRPLRAYAAALRELVAAVAASGRLARDPNPTRQGAGPARPAATSAAPAPPAQHRAPVFAAPTTSRPPTGGTPPPATGPPRRRRGVRIVAPDAGRPTGPQRPREDRVGAAAERVEQVG
ncbi:MAG: hypothetical protein ACXWYP_04775 [Pseudonocardia sp.]